MVTGSTWAAVLGLSLLSVLASAAGVGMALLIGSDRRAVAAGIGFSAGLMLLIAGIDLLPEAVRRGNAAGGILAAAAGAGLVVLLHLAVPHTHLVREAAGRGPLATRALSVGTLVALGLVLHDVPEGMALAGSYSVEARLGVLTAVVIAVHNVPEQMAMALPFVVAGRLRLLLGFAAMVAVAEPIGAVVGLSLSGLGDTWQLALVAFAAGAMLYIAIHELAPLAVALGPRPLALAGAGASVVVYLLLVVIAGL